MGDPGSIPGSGRSPGGGHGNPLQYSCLENPHGQRSLAGYSPWGCKGSDMTEQLSTETYDYKLLWWHHCKESSCQCSRHKRHGFSPWVKNPMDRGAWQTTVHRVRKNRTRLKRLSTHAYVQHIQILNHFVVHLKLM